MAEEGTPEGVEPNFAKVEGSNNWLRLLQAPTRATNTGDPALVIDEAIRRAESGEQKFQAAVVEVENIDELREGDVLVLRDESGATTYYLHHGKNVQGVVRRYDKDGKLEYEEGNARITGALRYGVLSVGRVTIGQGIRVNGPPQKTFFTDDGTLSDEEFAADSSSYKSSEHEYSAPIVDIRIIPVVRGTSSAKPA